MSHKADLVTQASCAAGTVIGGEYEVGQLIARGGVGEVYRVTHRTLQAELALKVLLPEHRDRDDVRLRFRTEGRALWEISHPNFVKVHHAGEDAVVGPFLVMELLRGRSLAALLARATIPFEQAIALTIQLAEACQAMHELEMIHRDLKPANVFLVAAGGGEIRAKLLDLGAAKIAKYGTPPTAEHMTVGTGRYMSPEHIACLPLSPASDVYSLAQIAFEMLTRSHPFDPAVAAPTSFDFQQWHLQRPPRRLSELCDEVPEEVSFPLKSGGVHFWTDRHIPERIEELDRHAELFFQHFLQIWEGGPGTADESANGRVAALLLVIGDSAADIAINADHRVADDLGHGVHFRILVVGVVATEMNETLRSFPLFRRFKIRTHFFGNGLRDRRTTDLGAADESFDAINEHEVGGACPEVDDERRLGDVGIIVAERVVERERSPVHYIRLQTCGTDGGSQFFHLVATGGHDCGLHLPHLRAHDLIIPGRLFQRERNRAPGFESHDFIDLVLGDRRKLNELRDKRIAWNGEIHVGVRGLEMLHQRVHCGLDGTPAIPFC